MGSTWRTDPTTHRTMSERSYHGATSRSLPMVMTRRPKSRCNGKTRKMEIDKVKIGIFVGYNTQELIVILLKISKSMTVYVCMKHGQNID